ncbi:MAG TPA: phosphate ABC transporter permease [Chroococcidiopsis sp.]
MLIPLTQEKFQELIPKVATGEQYKYCWGKPSDLLKRLLISVVGVVVVFIIKNILPEGLSLLEFIVGIFVSFYWLWGPAYLAGRRNAELRRYKYGGFLQGEVVDVFVTEELVGTEETVNKRGELVIVENRERRLNLEVEDDTGFVTKLQVPLKREHRSIRRGDLAEMIVMSNRADLSRISSVSDLYLPDYDLWVSDYPYLRRDLFLDVSRRLGQGRSPRRR